MVDCKWFLYQCVSFGNDAENDLLLQIIPSIKGLLIFRRLELWLILFHNKFGPLSRRFGVRIFVRSGFVLSEWGNWESGNQESGK